MGVKAVLLTINKRFEEIDNFISKELHKVDQKEASQGGQVIDDKLMKRIVQNTMQVSDRVKYDTGLQFMQHINDWLLAMNEAVVEFKNHRRKVFSCNIV